LRQFVPLCRLLLFGLFARFVLFALFGPLHL
jgi:hypothetical protein